MGDTTADNKMDEEARLKDKLVSKKKEVDLKNKLMAKKERRNSEESSSMKDNKGSPGSSNRARSRDRRSHSSQRQRRSHSSQRYVPPHRRADFHPRGGPNNFRGGGPPRGGGRGGWGPYPPGPRDRYYDIPPGPPYRGAPPPPGAYGGYPAGRGGYGPPPPRNHYMDPGQDPYGRALRPGQRYPPRSRSRSRSLSLSSRSRSLSRSYSRSRSRSRSPSNDDRRSSKKRGRSQDRSRSRRRKERRHHRSRRRSPSTSGSSISSSSSVSSSSSEESEAAVQAANDPFTKDQRTIFVNQLVMRTTQRDLRRYFRRQLGIKVKEVSFLEDRRTGKHKGCAYVELKTLDDVGKALAASGKPPDFQRFPILVKPSEAEKNYVIPTSTSSVTAAMMGDAARTAPVLGPNGQILEAQKVYVGNLDTSITPEHLYKLFSQFGELSKVQLQMDSSGISKGYAFLSFSDAKDANLAIQTMSNQILAGRGLKTGWATQVPATPGVQVVTSEEFPPDASTRAQKAHVALAQLMIGAGSAAGTGSAVPGSVLGGSAVSKIPTVAEARQGLAASLMGSAAAASAAANTVVSPTPAVPAAAAAAAAVASPGLPDAKIVGRADKPSKHLLIRNMFDKDEETEPGWADEIKEEFKDECQKFGKIERVLVMSKDPGGKIYASFDTIEAAKSCASSLAGRWFDKRQLRVEYVDEGDIPKEA